MIRVLFKSVVHLPSIIDYYCIIKKRSVEKKKINPSNLLWINIIKTELYATTFYFYITVTLLVCGKIKVPIWHEKIASQSLLKHTTYLPLYWFSIGGKNSIVNRLKYIFRRVTKELILETKQIIDSEWNGKERVTYSRKSSIRMAYVRVLIVRNVICSTIYTLGWCSLFENNLTSLPDFGSQLINYQFIRYLRNQSLLFVSCLNETFSAEYFP